MTDQGLNLLSLCLGTYRKFLGTKVSRPLYQLDRFSCKLVYIVRSLLITLTVFLIIGPIKKDTKCSAKCIKQMNKIRNTINHRNFHIIEITLQEIKVLLQLLYFCVLN